MSETEQANQRGAERHKIEAFVRIRGGESEYVFRTRDVSISGLFLFTKVARIYPIKVGDELNIELYDYDRFISVHAVVRRAVEPDSEESKTYPTGFGLEFVGLSEEAQGALTSMLERAAAGDSLY